MKQLKKTLMTKNAAITYAKNGIRVNSVHPGFINTLTESQDAALDKLLLTPRP